MKKILIVLGALFSLFVVAAVTVPLFVDVDKYRPQIVEKANESLNGKLDLGKLSLSLWGQIRVQIQGLKLTDTQGQAVVAVNDAYLHIPFTSILSGSPEIVLHMKDPTLHVVKEKSGKMNLMTLAKTASGQAVPPVPVQGATQAKAAPSGEMKLPGLVARARLGIEMQNALVSYDDQTTGMKSQVKDLNVSMRDLSLSRESKIEISANLDTEMKGLSVKGPAKISLRAHPTVSGGKFERVEANGKVDLDSLEILMPGTFQKKKGQDAHSDFAITASPTEAKIEHFDVKFFNADVRTQGTVSNLGSTQSPVVNVSVKSNTIDLKPWSELVPMLKDYDLSGTAELNGEANGPSDKLAYKGEFKVNGLTAKAPNLKAQPRIDAFVKVVTDLAEINATMKAPANDLKIAGKVTSFAKPRADFQITSSGMDLDQLIEMPKPAEKGAAKSSAGGGKSETGAAPKADYDAMLNSLRENKAMQEAVANVGVNIAKIKAQGVTISDITSKMSLKDLVAGIDSFGMKVFGGTIGMNAKTNLKPKAPTYQFASKIQNLDIQQAVDSQLHLLKNTVLGKASLEMTGQGASFNPDPAISNLNAKGKFRVDNATFSTIDVAKMVSGALNSAIEKVGDKIPGLKGKKIGGGGDSKYEFISSDFTIGGGKFSAPNFMTKAMPNRGIDLKGSTVVGLHDYALNANWEVIDTYNVTGAKDISAGFGGTQVNNLLAEGNGPVKFPITVGGTLMNPQYSYGQVPEYLAKVALSKATGAAKSQVQSQVKKQAVDLLKGKLKGLGGGFLGR